MRISAYQPSSTDPRADVPDAVPVGVDLAPLVRHLRVPLGAGRVGRELEAVALVGEGVDDHEEPVARRGVEVLLQVADDDRRRLVVAGEDAEVERLVVVKHARPRCRRWRAGPRAVRSEESRLATRRLVARPVRRARRPASIAAAGARRLELAFEVRRLVVDTGWRGGSRLGGRHRGERDHEAQRKTGELVGRQGGSVRSTLFHDAVRHVRAITAQSPAPRPPRRRPSPSDGNRTGARPGVRRTAHDRRRRSR